MRAIGYRVTKSMLIALTVVAGLVFPAVSVSAATTPSLSQTISAGTLATDILDASRVPVASPSAAMSAVNFSFACQTSTGTLGTASQRLYVTNGLGNGAGWTLSIAATGGATAKWQNGGATKNYNFNDATGSGCTNGQLTVNPATATVTADCVSSACTSSTITKGTSTAMTGSTAVTLMSGAVDSSVYRGYLTGVGLSQSIPAEQSPDSYSINMTLTVVAS